MSPGHLPLLLNYQLLDFPIVLYIILNFPPLTNLFFPILVPLNSPAPTTVSLLYYYGSNTVIYRIGTVVLPYCYRNASKEQEGKMNDEKIL